MLNFLIPKTKVQAFNHREVPIENFEIIGVGQINPYCTMRFENEIFISVVSIANDSKEYDEKEGLVLTKYFTKRRCPKCKRIELIPVRMRINKDSLYLKNEEEAAFDAYEEYPTKYNFPTLISAYCNYCSSCYEIRVKNKDLWVKQAKKIKQNDLITGVWERYQLD